MSIGFADEGAEQFWARLQKMSDEKLIETGKAARYMSDPRIQREVRPVFVMQLGECIAEWRRRHPRTMDS
jgi:hypothetical protein